MLHSWMKLVPIVWALTAVFPKKLPRNIQEELKAVQEGWLSSASGSEKAWEEQGKNRNFN